MTPGNIRALVVVPLYNHGQTVRGVVERALLFHPDVLVVDDGSTDGGSARLSGLAARVVRHERNIGKGAAVMSALRLAADERNTHLITVDADGQHDPADLPLFLAAIREDPDAIIVGKRDFEASAIPRLSRFGRGFSNFWLRVQTGVSLGDTQSGFRAYPVEVLKSLHLTERRFSFEIEVLVKAAWAGIALREVPVSVHYPPGNQRISHFHILRDNLRLTALNTRLTMRSMVPFPHRRLIPRTVEQGRPSVFHPVRSIRTLLAQNASPRELGTSAGLGVLIGAYPLLGLHTVLVLSVATYFRLNRLAALAANQLCTPPFVPALCIEVGHYLRHRVWLTEVSVRTLWYEAFQRLWEWILGALVLGPLLAVLLGSVTWFLAHALHRGMRGGRP